jgi:hypothetical protein
MEYDWTGDRTRKRKRIRFLLLCGASTALVATAASANLIGVMKREAPSLLSLNSVQDAEGTGR